MSGFVYHYTTEQHHLPLILESGYLRPSGAGCPVKEKPMLWFSRNQHCEPTAHKMVGKDLQHMRVMTFREQLEMFGWVRFGLPADDPRLLNWKTACSKCGMDKRWRLALEKAGRKQGGSPADWLAIDGVVLLRELRLQRFDGEAWVDMEDVSGERGIVNILELPNPCEVFI